MPVPKLLDNLLMPVFAAERSTLDDEEPVTNHEIDVCQDDSDRLHDVPGKVEVDEIMDEGYFSHDESSEQPHSPVRFLSQLTFSLSDLFLQNLDFVLDDFQ